MNLSQCAYSGIFYVSNLLSVFYYTLYFQPVYNYYYIINVSYL